MNTETKDALSQALAAMKSGLDNLLDAAGNEVAPLSQKAVDAAEHVLTTMVPASYQSLVKSAMTAEQPQIAGLVASLDAHALVALHLLRARIDALKV